MTRAGPVGVLLALTLGACGSQSGGDDRAGRFDPFDEVQQQPPPHRAEQASARWEPVGTFAGSGPARRSFSVDRRAIQWRVRWSCESGRLGLSRPAAGRRKILVDARCPDRGTSTDVRAGTVPLDVRASGRWRVRIEQQVDTPLHEAPLRAMRSPGARVLSRGRFYDLERKGRGTASLYRLAGGRLALRLEDFATSANTDLFVWLSPAARPRSSAQAARAHHVVLRALKSTVGDQNYVLPAGLPATDVRSVVIWCVPVRIAYTAAALSG